MNRKEFLKSIGLGTAGLIIGRSMIGRLLAKAIYDIDEFIENIVGVGLFKEIFDEVLEYCKTSPNIDEAMQKFPEQILEYELDGKIRVENGKVFLN